MFAMHQHQHVQLAPPPPHPRQYAGHGISSAFSSSANPDEDWTKISDLAERRRIQNRIAQRNYRKKLKRRLEDLERRASSSDPGSPPLADEKPSTASPVTKTTLKAPKQQAVPKHMTQGLLSPPMHHCDMLLASHASYDERERTHSPPFMGYSAYPPPDDMIMGPYGSQPQQAYRSMAAESYPHYMELQGVPVTLPSMTDFSDAIKRDSAGYHTGEDSMSPYMNYDYLPGIDMGAGPTATSYDHSNPHTPPLLHSYDHSANCSDSGYEYPITPLSMPPSPPTQEHSLRH